MSKDPLEELFGPIDEEPEPFQAPAPPASPAPRASVPATPEPARTAQLDTDRAGDPAANRKARMVPWIVVGAVAVVAIIASIVTLSIARGTGNEPEPTATQTEAPTTTDTTEPEPTSEPSEKPSEETGDVPKVDVGQTNNMPIAAWNATSDISAKFGSVQYNITGDDLVLSSALIDSLPSSCEAMKAQWGATKNGTKYELLKPSGECTAAPELYDELWGLTDAFVRTIRPAA